LTDSTKSSHQDLPTQVKTIWQKTCWEYILNCKYYHYFLQLTPLTFTQKLQQCSRRIKSRPTSKVLSPLQSPIYATPPHSPNSEEPSAPSIQGNAINRFWSVYKFSIFLYNLKKINLKYHSLDYNTILDKKNWLYSLKIWIELKLIFPTLSYIYWM